MYNDFVDVEKEYDKDPELRREDVKVLQEWMEKQPHLPKISELKIVLFLHSCYCKVEATKHCIETYYTIRTHYPPIFGNRDVSSQGLQNAIELGNITALTVESEYKYVLLGMHNSNPEICNVEECFKMIDIMTHLIYMRKGISKGHIVVLDGTGIKVGHALRFSLVGTKVFLHYVQSALPIRLAAVHIVNISPAAEKIYNFVKPFIKNDMADLMFLHSSLESLYEHIPKDILPSNLGGCGPSYKDVHDEQVKIFEANAEYIIADSLEKADESKRIGQRIDFGGMFGIEGTFKKLEID